MAVKARFYVHSITKNNTGFSTVVLHAVTRSTDDNVDWSKFTPSGKLDINVSNDTGAIAEFNRALDEGKDVAFTLEVID